MPYAKKDTKSPQFYRRLADQCRETARMASAEEEGADLLARATTWNFLAEQQSLLRSLQRLRRGDHRGHLIPSAHGPAVVTRSGRLAKRPCLGARFQTIQKHAKHWLAHAIEARHAIIVASYGLTPLLESNPSAEPTSSYRTRLALVSDSRSRLSSADRPGSGSPKNAAVRLC